MYAIVLRYKRPLSEVDKHVDAHRAWLRKNYADGTFLVSGRQRSGTGGFFFPPANEPGPACGGFGRGPFRPKELPRYRKISRGAAIGGRRTSLFVPGTRNLLTHA